MAITRIATSSLKTLNKYDDFLAGNPPYIPVSYDSISTITVGAGGTTSVTFSSIPQTYTHLQIRGISRNNRASQLDGVYFRANSDTGTNYSFHSILGSGATATVDSATSSTFFQLGIVAASNATASVFGGFVADVLDYTNTNKYKTVRSIGGYDSNGNGYAVFDSGSWRNTAAITSITLGSSDGSGLLQYSSFALYGIKG